MTTIVLVTFNRLEKLKKAVKCYDKQTVTPECIIVVDNNSTDGTKEWLKLWLKEKCSYNKEVITSPENIGGSGGFHLGQKRAIEIGSDWVFIADDDAYPCETMIEIFTRYLLNHDSGNVAAACAKVLNPCSNIVCSHRGYLKKYGRFNVGRTNSTEEDYRKEEFEIDLLSYVGSFINVRALKEVGLVNKNYFIYHDDTEHSLRLKRWGRIICLPELEIVHDGDATLKKNNYLKRVDWKDYYDWRNELHCLKKHAGLAGWNYIRHFFIRVYIRHEFHGLESKVRKASLWDAIFNRLGKHKTYKPGWSAKVEI